MTWHKTCHRFLRSTRGSATVEFAVILPAFFTFILIAADTSTAFTRISQMWSVSQQTARIVSRHGLDSDGGEDYAQAQLSGYAPDVAVTVDEAKQLVTVVVSVEAADIAPFGIISHTLSDKVSVSFSQALEPI